jgi:hypothetical protein
MDQDIEHFDPVASENNISRTMFDLEEVLEFQSKHKLELTRDESFSYLCWIDGKVWSTTVTPLAALTLAIKTYKTVNK